MEAFTEVDFPLPSVEELASLSVSSFGYQLPAHQLPVYHRHVCSILLACAGLKKIDLQTAEDLGDGVINSASPSEAVPSASTEDDEDLAEAVVVHQQTPSANIASRSYTPVAAESQENPLSAWTVKCNLSIPASDGPQEFPDKCPLSRPLYGKRVLIKDNIPICGLPMYCGTSFSFTPLADSPLITRCLDAGATIVGKSQCEYMCLSGASHTASAGLVRNPNAPEYHAGGSSSGCAALVFAGEADLSIGCDQGGSCRIPAAMCGVVGCKPTHGLVPYTYIDGMYGPIDHAGPITGTVEDNALMLGVLAGWDGADERPSPAARVQEKVDYCKSLKEGVQGMRVGVVSEALRMPFVQDDVKKAIEDCAQVLRGLGAEVDSISMPLHFTSLGIWVSNALPSLVQSLFYSTEKDRLFGVDDHGKVYDRLTFLRENLLKQVSSWSVPFRTSILAGEWLRIRFPESKKVAEVHRQRLVGSYCAALREFDVLLLPTTARKAKKLPTHLSSGAEYEQASAELLGEHAEMGEGMSVFTLCFNVTGHPALTVPVGLGLGGSPPTLLPIGAMLVANYFQEASLYRVGYALEQARHHPPSYTTHGLPPTWRSG